MNPTSAKFIIVLGLLAVFLLVVAPAIANVIRDLQGVARGL